LSREDLMRHMAAHPRTSVNLLGEMARRLAPGRRDHRPARLCGRQRAPDPPARRARSRGGCVRPDGLVVRRRPTQQELANMIGSCRGDHLERVQPAGGDGLIIPRGRSLVVTPR